MSSIVFKNKVGVVKINEETLEVSVHMKDTKSFADIEHMEFRYKGFVLLYKHDRDPDCIRNGGWYVKAGNAQPGRLSWSLTELVEKLKKAREHTVPVGEKGVPRIQHIVEGAPRHRPGEEPNAFWLKAWGC